MKKIVIPCSNAIKLGKNIAKELKSDLAEYETRKFPDGEIYFRIDSDLKDKEAIVVQSGYPNPNDAVIELFLAISAAREMGAEKITVVVPYFPYARQDKKFKEGEAFSLKIIANIFKTLGVGFVVTVDAHFRKDYGDYDFFGIPAQNISSGPLLAKYIKEKFSLGDLQIVSPDFGASGMVELAAKESNSTATVLEKKRSGDFEVDVKGELDVSGKSVLVLDDIISTGGTMVKATGMVKDAGSEKVFAAATHGLFVGDSMKKLKESTDYLVTSDAIGNETSKVSLAGVIVEVLK